MACILYVTLLCPIPPPKKAEDINPKVPFLWNNGQMKIAYNSAYIQTKSLNFTFAR